MQHVHDSRLRLHELHRADLLDDAAQVHLAARSTGSEPVRLRLGTLRGWLTGAGYALRRGLRWSFARAACTAARTASGRLRSQA